MNPDHRRLTSPAGDLAFVALGSNLGDSPALIRAAMERLESLSELPLQRSSLWRSTPVDCPPGSPAFVNAVVAITPRPGLTAESLLAILQDIERQLGRLPKRVPNEPRPLDLDLLAFGRETRTTPALTLPHPRAHLRRFVLQPLAEIAPGFRAPGWTADAAALLAALVTPEVLEQRPD